MAKARKSSKPSEVDLKAKDAAQKQAEQEVRIRHVEGMRQKMSSGGLSGEEISPMVDAGFNPKGLPVVGRTHRENLLTQMKKAGVDVTRPTPGISRANPDTQMGISNVTGKPFMSSAVAKEKSKSRRGFKSLAKRILTSVRETLSGSHQRVGKKQISPSKFGGMIHPPVQRYGPSPK